MKRRWQPRLGGESGAAAIEFAILLLLLLVLLFGIIEFGFLWTQSHYVAQASREGARAGARVAAVEDGELTNAGEIQTVVDATVTTSLDQLSFYAGKVDELATIDTPQLVTVEGVPSLQVRVTVHSAEVWPPVLWGLLSLLPGGDENNGVEYLSSTAVFAIAQHH